MKTIFLSMSRIWHSDLKSRSYCELVRSILEIMGEPRIVYSLDRVFVKGSQHLVSIESYNWIEGIGYSFGFLFNKDQLDVVPRFTYLDFTPLCYTSPKGDIYKFHPADLCEVNQTNRTTAPLVQKSLDVQFTRDQLGLTIQVNDGKHHELMVYRYDGTTLVGMTSFYESYALALPHTTGEKIFIVIDNETIPYVL